MRRHATKWRPPQTWELIENKESIDLFFLSQTWEHTENKATYSKSQKMDKGLQIAR